MPRLKEITFMPGTLKFFKPKSRSDLAQLTIEFMLIFIGSKVIRHTANPFDMHTKVDKNPPTLLSFL